MERQANHEGESNERISSKASRKCSVLVGLCIRFKKERNSTSCNLCMDYAKCKHKVQLEEKSDVTLYCIGSNIIN